MASSDRANSRHLTYKYPAYEGCTFEELLLTVLGLAMIQLPAITLLSWWLGEYVGGFWGACLLLLLFHVLLDGLWLVRLILRSVARRRAGRSPGFLLLGLLRWANTTLGLPIPYVTHRGTWSLRRHRT